MKKGNIIASVLILSIMLMGAGYAYWTDSAKVTNTVNSGNMNVEFVNVSETCPLIHLPNIGNLEKDSDYVESSINLDDSKTITVTVDNLYPGTGVLYAAKFENKGTIPAVIESVEVNFTEDNELLKDNLIVLGGFVQIRPSKCEIVDSGAFPTITHLSPIEFGPCNLKDLETNLNNMLKGKRLEPGDYVLFDIPKKDKNDIAAILDAEGIDGYKPEENNCIIMGLPKTKGDQNNLKNQHIQFQIKLNFKQFNA
jgi:predicted ribosomally synthesized peptide with SipW-like signal peptide